MEANRLHRARLEAESNGRLIDLTDTHFGRAGIRPPEDVYTRAWERWRARPEYDGSALGRLATREAVARWYGDSGVNVDPDAVLLTAGSSVSYHLLFSVLSGDRRTGPAVPRPAYPLFEDLALAVGLEPVYYDLDPGSAWRPDRDSVTAALALRPCCIVVVSPNNPCGSVLNEDDLSWICATAAETGVPVVADEVFGSFVYDLPRGRERAPSALEFARSAGAQVYQMNGLSKLAAAPEVKLGWITASATDAPAWSQIEYAHDTYLSTSAFAEHVGELFFTEGAEWFDKIRKTVRERRNLFVDQLKKLPGISFTPPAGGVHALFSIDQTHALTAFGTTDDEQIAVSLIADHGVFVHPGYLFGIEADDPNFAVSFLIQKERMREGMTRLRAALSGGSTRRTDTA